MWLRGRFGGSVARMRRQPLDSLRRELRSLPGLDAETTDTLLLYGAGRPVFVADASVRRVLVRERLAAGDTDAQVLAFVEARYGAFVLLRPRLTPRTVLLWTTPLLLLAGAAAYLWRVRLRPVGGRPETIPLSAEEQRRLDELMRADQPHT